MIAAILLSGLALNYPAEDAVTTVRFPKGYRGEYCHTIRDASKAFNVDPTIVRFVIRQESGFDRYAVSRAGAEGLMQLIPDTANRFSVSDSFDARQNIYGGVRYLRWLMDAFDGDLYLVLAGYNAGENAVRRWQGIPPYAETRLYVTNITSRVGAR